MQKNNLQINLIQSLKWQLNRGRSPLHLPRRQSGGWRDLQKPNSMEFLSAIRIEPQIVGGVLELAGVEG